MELLWQLIILDTISISLRSPLFILEKLNRYCKITESQLLNLLDKMEKDGLIKSGVNHFSHSGNNLEKTSYKLTTLGHNILGSLNEKYRDHTKLTDFI